MTQTLCLGIDPGIHGAIAILDRDGQLTALYDMPTLRQGGVVGRSVDPYALASLLAPYAQSVSCAVVEGVTARKGNGVASAHSLGHSLGVVLGVLAAFDVPILLPAPALWKRAMGVTAKKESSLRAFAHHWPGEDPGRHDRAEAALLARFGWLQGERGIAEAERQWAARRVSEGAVKESDLGHSSKQSQKKPRRGAGVREGSIDSLSGLGVAFVEPD